MARGPFAIVLAVALATCACSGGGVTPVPTKTPEERFQTMDTNGDGKVSLEEYKEYVKVRSDPERMDEAMKRAEVDFKEMDKNHDGFISLEEYKAAPPRRGRGGRGSGGNRGT